MSTYAIGDIQGCYEPLICLLERANFDPHRDHLWVAGDMVNRGPNSLETLRFLMGLGGHATVVLGNHDLHLLGIAEGIRRLQPNDSIQDILTAPDRDDLLDWVRRQPLLHYDAAAGYVLVHAGLPPQWDITQALALAQEVQTTLRGPTYKEFLYQMYGNEPNRWDPRLTGWSRLRLITNYLTRMRLCAADGELELSHHQGVANTPAGYHPWFTHPHRKTRDLKILFGHWAALEGESNHDHVFALDTGCVWGRKLTMMRLEDHQIFSCDCEQALSFA